MESPPAVPRITVPLILLATALGLAGCSDPDLSEPLVEAPDQTAVLPKSEDILRPGESDFRAFAAHDSSFAGYYLRGDEIVVLTTDLARSSAIEAEMNRRRSAFGIDAAALGVRVEEAEYSFVTLNQWRSDLGEIWNVDDVVGLDLDELNNQLHVFLRSGAGASEVLTVASRAGVPPEAISFEVSGEIVPAVDSLGDRLRPVEGGYGIYLRDSSGTGIGNCTYGFSAVLDSDTIFVTASHCTSDTFGLDSSRVSQRTFDSIGVEVSDPEGFDCIFDDECRLSDAAVFRFSENVPNDSIGFTKIARTTYRSLGTSSDGSREIDSTDPYFTIIGEYGTPPGGTVHNKIGLSSGWTYGSVITTCASVELAGSHRLLCGYRVNARTEIGDSGAPVFGWPLGDDRVVLSGIISARDGNHKGWFSTMPNIQYELGNLKAADFSGSGGPLSVTISGPEVAPEHAYELCGWSADVSGSSGTVSYIWKYDHAVVGTNDNWTGDTGSEGTHLLEVDVWDSQATDHDEFVVAVDDSEFGECL